jgi:hypothetical protein
MRDASLPPYVAVVRGKGEKMTPLVLLLVLNAGMLMGFVLHTFLDGAHRGEATRPRMPFEPASAFRDDLLVPILPSKNRYLH